MQHGPDSAMEEHGNFRRGDRNADVDQQRDGRPTREEPDKDEQAEKDFHDPDEGGQNVGLRDADFREPSDSQCGWEQELLDSLGQEYPADENADEQDALGTVVERGCSSRCVHIRPFVSFLRSCRVAGLVALFKHYSEQCPGPQPRRGQCFSAFRRNPVTPLLAITGYRLSKGDGIRGQDDYQDVQYIACVSGHLAVMQAANESRPRREMNDLAPESFPKQIKLSVEGMLKHLRNHHIDLLNQGITQSIAIGAAVPSMLFHGRDSEGPPRLHAGAARKWHACGPHDCI